MPSTLLRVNNVRSHPGRRRNRPHDCHIGCAAGQRWTIVRFSSRWIENNVNRSSTGWKTYGTSRWTGVSFSRNRVRCSYISIPLSCVDGWRTLNTGSTVEAIDTYSGGRGEEYNSTEQDKSRSDSIVISSYNRRGGESGGDQVSSPWYELCSDQGTGGGGGGKYSVFEDKRVISSRVVFLVVDPGNMIPFLFSTWLPSIQSVFPKRDL